jgi:pteridine reductase
MHPPAAEMIPTGGGARSRTRPVALVTGAARRVGRAVAVSLARAGCDVYFTYHQSNVEAETLASELAGLGSTGNFYQLDFADTDAVEAFAANLAATLPRLDILVHNASIYTPSPVSDVTAEDAVRQYRVNALAPLILTAKLSALLGASELAGGGAVVACADIHAMGRPRRDFAAYSMSKGALAEMVHSLARDLAPAVRVNAIAPGVVAWPESGTDADEPSQQKYLRRVPLGRAGTPEDAAEVVRWLAMDAVYLTGEIIRVDGGRWLT